MSTKRIDGKEHEQWKLGLQGGSYEGTLVTPSPNNEDLI